MPCDCHHHHNHHEEAGHSAAKSSSSWLVVCLAGLLLGLLAEHYQWRAYPVPYLLGLYAGGLPRLVAQAWGRRPDIHSLMGLAVLAAVALGHWAEGVFLLLLFEGAEELERLASQRSEDALRALLNVRPVRARRVHGEECLDVPVEEIEVGDWIEIRGGELVPLDGTVRDGAALVDCSSLTGESVPRFVEPGGQLLSGAKLLEGSLRLECQAKVHDSTLARAAELIRTARQDKLRLQTDIERWTGWYAAGLPLFALFYGSAAYLSEHLTGLQALYRALSLLVVGSPCALVLASPSVFLTGLVQAARSGILIKGSRHLERLADIRDVAFDKTGTLTTGQFHLVGMVVPAGYDESGWMALAASLESRSQHPLGLSLVAAARDKDLPLEPVIDFWSHPGRGIQGKVAGQACWMGRQIYLKEFDISIPAELEQASLTWQSEGETVVWAASQKGSDPVRVGCFRLADCERPEAAAALLQLQQLNIKPFLLTGDSRPAAARVANRLGLTQYHAELLPEDKVEAIRRRNNVAMIGDGVNDAPALATAAVGIAMGASGSELAIESSDVVLLSSDLRGIPQLLKLARTCRWMVIQNLTLAGLTIVGLAVGVITGQVGLANGVLGHEGSTILVVLNGLRLLRTPGQPGPVQSNHFSLDKLGVTVSSLCLVHCLVFPVLLAVLPGLGWLNPDERIHWLLTLAAVPVAAFALLPGYRIHRCPWVLWAGLMGLLLMVGTPFFWTGLFEEVATSIGAICLVTAHLQNRRRCKAMAVCCASHHG